MKEYTNFYETVKEAEMRLLQTAVMYDGEPYYVIMIANHKKDGVFRIYLDKMGTERGLSVRTDSDNPAAAYPSGGMGDSLANMMDAWLETERGKKSGVIRKMMNSPAFNKFRPFDLGMCNNAGGVAVYCERQPTRHTQQGLMHNMVSSNPLYIPPLDGDRKFISKQPDFYGIPFFDCIMGKYPTACEALTGMMNPKVGGGNSSVAFHRNFAFVRGPMDLMFLAYKSDIVGLLPMNDFSVVRLDKKFVHCREVIGKLGLFGEIKL